jgi:predicted AlkP superfamily pyrophosphatase or phosphodiesterase
LTAGVPAPFRGGPSPGTVLPEYGGLGFAKIAPTVLGHFGLDSALPPLSSAVLPPELLQGADRIVTLLVDALGHEQLARALERGLAPRLTSLAERPGARLGVLTSTFPSTTPTALTTFGVGLAPGEHGVVNQIAYDASLGTVVDILRFAPAHAGRPLEQAGLEPAEWIGLPTVYERLRGAGVASTVARQGELRDTSLSKINDRGARYVGFRTLSDMCAQLRAAIKAASGPAYIHAYWGALDTLAHKYGVASPQHDAEVRLLDYALGELLLGGLRSPKTLLLLFADHGQLDSGPERRVWLNDHPELLGLLAAPPAGLWRAIILYVRPGREEEARGVAERLLGAYADVFTTEEAERLRLYGPGPLTAVARQRAGQLLLVPHEDWLIEHHYPGGERAPSRKIGQHAGLSPEEMLVPLLAVRLD